MFFLAPYHNYIYIANLRSMSLLENDHCIKLGFLCSSNSKTLELRVVFPFAQNYNQSKIQNVTVPQQTIKHSR